MRAALADTDGPLLPDHWAQPLADMGGIEIDENGGMIRILPDPPGILEQLEGRG